MLFFYKAVTKDGRDTAGEIEAQTLDAAIGLLQRQGLVVVSVRAQEKKNLFEFDINIFNRVSPKEVAILSRQIATLLEAHVPALKTFRLLSAESENPLLGKKLSEISDDIQNGVAISDALNKHPSVFPDFYVNMIRGGEESGRLPETFISLADYLERSYELVSKARGALIYPAFVIATFFIVMALMLVLVIPKLADIITQSGQDVPVYTKAVMGLSSFLIHYGVLFAAIVVATLFVIWRYTRGTNFIARAKIWAPGVGLLYRTLYLSRIADNMHTMLEDGISMVRSLEITADVVDNDIFRDIIEKAVTEVKAGAPLSAALEKYHEIPTVMIQMIKVGEETGELAGILDKLSIFYRREVNTAINTVISMIQPMMIVALGVGVGGVLASVLVPIYQIAGSV